MALASFGGGISKAGEVVAADKELADNLRGLSLAVTYLPVPAYVLVLVLVLVLEATSVCLPKTSTLLANDITLPKLFTVLFAHASAPSRRPFSFYDSYSMIIHSALATFFVGLLLTSAAAPTTIQGGGGHPVAPLLTAAQKSFIKSTATTAYSQHVQPGSIKQVQIQNEGGSKGIIASISKKDAKGKQIIKVFAKGIKAHLAAQGDEETLEAIEEERNAEDENGDPKNEGSDTLAGIATSGLIHEFYHAAAGTGAENDVYSGEHLAIDRAVSRDLCDLVKSMRCDGVPSSAEITPEEFIAGLCQQVTFLNDKWENTEKHEDAADAAAEGGMTGAFPQGVPTGDPTATPPIPAPVLDLPTPAELDADPQSAVPDCDCCTSLIDDCCPTEE